MNLVHRIVVFLAPHLREAAMSAEALGPKPIVHQAAPKVAAANTVAPPIPAATEPAAHVGLVGNVEAVIEHALHPTVSATPVVPAQPAAATASLDALAQEVKTRIAAHQTYKAYLASAQVSHDTTLAAMKANASALVTAQTNLASSVAADTATVNAAVTDANAAT